ncbi:MAG: hypothetical protein PHS60_08655, partial [Zavarzinia sp.]|nr:hypothetical protein [Zavarzinia sp.]
MKTRPKGEQRPDSSHHRPLIAVAPPARARRGLAAAVIGALLVTGCGSSGAAVPEAAYIEDVKAIEVRSLAGGYLAARFAGGVQDAFASARFYEDALRLDPGNTGLRRQAMMSSLLVGNYLDAATHAEIIARLEKADTIAPLIATIGELRTGRYEAALKRLEALPSNSAL